MDKMVFFNTAWMDEYKGVTENDKPKHGGAFIPEKGYGNEIYNFQPYDGKLYGFVEPGYTYRGQKKLFRININKLGASKSEKSISGVLIVWVALNQNHPQNVDQSRTAVVGWYKNATLYRNRQEPPEGSKRLLSSGEQAHYFAEADEKCCHLVRADERSCFIPRGKDGFGQSNICHAIGERIKVIVLEYIRNQERA